MNKSVLYFITDLDRTIIHSKNPGYRCVEYIGEREITYMTDFSYDILQKLLQRDDFMFIPCTMRNLFQVVRIDFLSSYPLPFMICTNGAQIYINGKLDLVWDSYMRSIISEEQVLKDFRFVESLELNYLEIRNTEGFYISLKFKFENEAKLAIEPLKNMVPYHLKIIQIGRKIFVMNEKIDKMHAVNYLVQKFRLKRIVTAGDSEVDKFFTTIGKSILPQHASFRHEYAIITKAAGIQSTEEVLAFLESQLD